MYYEDEAVNADFQRHLHTLDFSDQVSGDILPIEYVPPNASPVQSMEEQDNFHGPFEFTPTEARFDNLNPVVLPSMEELEEVLGFRATLFEPSFNGNTDLASQSVPMSTTYHQQYVPPELPANTIKSFPASHYYGIPPQILNDPYNVPCYNPDYSYAPRYPSPPPLRITAPLPGATLAEIEKIFKLSEVKCQWVEKGRSCNATFWADKKAIKDHLMLYHQSFPQLGQPMRCGWEACGLPHTGGAWSLAAHIWNVHLGWKNIICPVCSKKMQLYFWKEHLSQIHPEVHE